MHDTITMRPGSGASYQKHPEVIPEEGTGEDVGLTA